MSALLLLHAVGKLPFCCTQGQLWVACWSILRSSQVRAGKSLVGETAMSCCRPPCKFQAVMPASRNNSLSIPVPKFFSPNFNPKEVAPQKKTWKLKLEVSTSTWEHLEVVFVVFLYRHLASQTKWLRRLVVPPTVENSPRNSKQRGTEAVIAAAANTNNHGIWTNAQLFQLFILVLTSSQETHKEIVLKRCDKKKKEGVEFKSIHCTLNIEMAVAIIITYFTLYLYIYSRWWKMTWHVQTLPDSPMLSPNQIHRPPLHPQKIGSSPSKASWPRHAIGSLRSVHVAWTKEFSEPSNWRSSGRANPITL